jgi:hypothetical protein
MTTMDTYIAETETLVLARKPVKMHHSSFFSEN